MKIIDLKKFNIPDKPGVYFFLKGKDILYIGKATSLKDRTKSYFSKDIINTRGPLILDMVFKSDTVKYQETDSVLEALILEANLIKKHQPYYNTKEKDDKSFNYVCVTKDKLPQVIIMRGKELPKYSFKKIYGPFTSGGQLKEALKIIRKIFPFLDSKSKNNYEFYKQINLVPDLERTDVLKNNIKNIQLFFEGKKNSVLKSLEKQMKSCIKIQNFEQANLIKKQIFSLKHINDVSLIKEDVFARRNFFSGPRVKSPDQLEKISPRSARPDIFKNHSSIFRIEAYDIAHMGGKDMVGVMVVLHDGELVKNEYRKFIIKNYTSSNDTGALSEILTRRFKHTEWQMPDLIVVDGGTAQRNVALKILKEFNLKIPVSAVVKDDKHKAKMILSADPKLKKDILLANSEAHRFAIKYHKEKRNKSFIS